MYQETSDTATSRVFRSIDLLDVGEIDSPVARPHQAHVEAALLQLAVENQRALEMQRVGDDVAVRLVGGIQAEAVDDDVLAAAGALDQADFVRRWR